MEKAMKKVCTICNGVGYIPVANDPLSRQRCRCTVEALYIKKLGPEVFLAPALEQSPYDALTSRDVFITANRKDFMPHLRHALITKGLGFFSRITNDTQMLDAWLSKERQHTQETSAAGADFTSLRDLMEEPELVVLFLGIVSYPNKALPAVLLEALRIRQFAGKPTWVVNPHIHPFCSGGNYCWSPEGEEYIAGNFLRKTIKPSTVVTPLSQGLIADGAPSLTPVAQAPAPAGPRAAGSAQEAPTGPQAPGKMRLDVFKR